MAKGDGGGSAAANQPPKQDQYSVMHGIMDRLHPMGPSGNFNPGNPAPYIGGSPNGAIPGSMGGNSAPNLVYSGNQTPDLQIGRAPISTGNGGGLPQASEAGVMYPQSVPSMQSLQQSPIGPANPQELIRRMLMSQRTFAGGQ